MHEGRLAPHESLEIHELINFKTICLAQSKFMQGLVFDKELKSLMQEDVEQSVTGIRELTALYQNAPFRAHPQVVENA